MKADIIPSSFRDPSGSLFAEDGCLYRRVNESCEVNYDRLIRSGLYRDLSSDGLLVRHEEVTLSYEAAVRKLPATREDVFPDYTQSGFEGGFGELFRILESSRIKEPERTLYRMARKSP